MMNFLNDDCRGRNLFKTARSELRKPPLGFVIALTTQIAILSALFKDARADTVWVIGQNVPVSGQIVSTTGEKVEIRTFENGQFSKTITIPRTGIEQVVTNIDVSRLSQLDPGNPVAYRDYAEELASQKSDPAARDLARRLYLIAAKNSEDAIQRSSLAGLVSIAESDSERQRFSLLQSLIDPESSGIGFSRPDTSVISLSSAQKQLMLDLIQAIRREKSDLALRLLSSSKNRIVFKSWSELCSLVELDRMARVNRPSKSQLGKLVMIESQLTSSNHGTEVSTSRQLGWGDFATQVSGNLSVLPSFNNVTKFDPEKSVYRDGEWVKP